MRARSLARVHTHTNDNNIMERLQQLNGWVKEWNIKKRIHYTKLMMMTMGAVCICLGEWRSVRRRRIVSMRSHCGGLNTVTADSPCPHPLEQFSHLSKHYYWARTDRPGVTVATKNIHMHKLT